MSLSPDASARRSATTLVAGLLAAIAVSGCGASDGGSQPTPKVTVRVDESGYKPQKVKIPVGTRVTWVNVGEGGQTANSVGVPEVLYDRTKLVKRKMFDIHTIQPGEADTVLFTRPGRYVYFSSLDNDNVGLVTVTDER